MKARLRLRISLVEEELKTEETIKSISSLLLGTKTRQRLEEILRHEADRVRQDIEDDFIFD